MTKLNSLKTQVLINAIAPAVRDALGKDLFEEDPYYRGPDPTDDRPHVNPKRHRTHPTSPRKHNVK